MIALVFSFLFPSTIGFAFPSVHAKSLIQQRGMGDGSFKS